MLELINISKTYKTGDFIQKALDQVNIKFRENEFISILGPSGSGKTTMLNIIGGLDRYDQGDLLINGRSTKDYKDKEWDNYRNKSIGFVFQSYNLIPHQNVLSNVELALTLAGISKKEGRQRALEVLEKVGLKDHVNKKPNQLSGGQMQRVAIARALINNPDILLADEPTGALDSKTSVQIMNLLKEIAEEKLVIMVTHNPDLAEEYSTRVVNLLDGQILSDTDPYNDETKTGEGQLANKKEKTSMSFLTALGLSFNNLKTKKGRTILTAFAGSIGIIGIALILALSSGMHSYIAQTEEDTLSSYPISIESRSLDMMSFTGPEQRDTNRDKLDESKIFQGGFAGDNLKMTSLRFNENDLESFKTYLESDKGQGFRDNTKAIQYLYDASPQIFIENEDLQQVNPSNLMDSGMPGADAFSQDIFTELLDNPDLVRDQYRVLEGRWPENYRELIVVLDENNQLSDLAMYTLGLKDTSEIDDMREKFNEGEDISSAQYGLGEFNISDLIGRKYKLVNKSDFFVKEGNIWLDKSQDKEFMRSLVSNGEDLEIVGVIKPSEDAVSKTINGEVAYLSDLSRHIIETSQEKEVVRDQQNNPDVNILTGKNFVDVSNMDDEEFTSILTDEERAQLNLINPEDRPQYFQSLRQSYSMTYDQVLSQLGAVDYNNPKSINLYLKDFKGRDLIIEEIDKYNEEKINEGQDDSTIEYTDLVGLMMSSITSIIDIVTYLLIGFVSISLIVSSIMIGIITYISVLERTKEIGVLRSIGASKKDVGRVFNAETTIIGLAAGAIGILVSLLILIPINIIINRLADVESLAYLPPIAAIALILISVLLTMVAGLIPARMASKKDPVIALRSE